MHRFHWSIVFWLGMGMVWPAFAEPAAPTRLQQSDAEAFVDVWALRRQTIALLALPQENYDECNAARHQQACTRKQARIEKARQRSLDRFNEQWLPALLRAMVKGDPVAETVLRLCEALPQLQRQGIAADCSPSAQDRAFALQRLKAMGFQPAIQAFAPNVLAMRAQVRPGCGYDDSTDARRCRHLADTRRLQSILDAMQTGYLATAESWNTCQVNDRVVELDLIVQECAKLNLMMMAVAAEAPRFYAAGPTRALVVGVRALTLARPMLSGEPAEHPYARLFEGRRTITRNNFAEFSDPQATERFYAARDAFIAGMQANIDADLRRDPRWAVFLIERIDGGLFDAMKNKDPRRPPAARTKASDDQTPPPLR